MKVLITIFLLCIFKLCYAHENVIVKHEYENVSVYSSTCFYTEEINRNLIIGQYVQLLSEKKKFNKKIKIIFLQDFVENILINANKNTEDGFDLQIAFIAFDISIPETVSVVNHIIDDYENIPKKKAKHYTWRNAEETSTVRDILNNKIYRPNIVKELEYFSEFSYYFQEDSFFVENKQTCDNQSFIQVNDIKQFKPLNNNLLVIIDGDAIGRIISFNCKYDINKKIYKPKNFIDNFKIPEDQYNCFTPYNIVNLSDQIFFESDKKQLHSYSLTKRKFSSNINS